MGVAVALLVIAVLVRLPTLAQPLLERHPFRQTHTAYTALRYHEHGIDLLRPELPVLGPPFVLPFEFPLFEAAAALVMSTGLEPDMAMRVTGLATFLLTGILVWVLTRHAAGTLAAHVALIVFLFSAHGMAWGRTSMIEYLATAGSVGAVLAAALWSETGRWRYWILAVAAAIVAMTVKVTTGLYWLIPLVAVTTPHWRSGTGRIAVGLAVAIPLGLSALWTAHSDSIKASDAASAWTTSSALAPWYFGTLQQRLDPEQWAWILYYFDRTAGLPFFFLLLLGLRSPGSPRYPWLWPALGAACALPILTFFNQYYAHDYYVSAISPAIAVLIGHGAARIWGVAGARRRMIAAIGALSAAAVALNSLPHYSLSYARIDDHDGILAQARELSTYSRPDELVLVLGRDWSPSVPYYARRVGLVLPDRYVERALDEAWLDKGYRVASVARPGTDPIEVLRHWRYIAVMGRNTYLLRDVPDPSTSAPVVAVVEAPAAPQGSDPRRVDCDSGMTLPRGTHGTWLYFETDRPAGARVDIGSYASLPLVPAIYLDPAAWGGAEHLALRCSGTASLDLISIAPGRSPHVP